MKLNFDKIQVGYSKENTLERAFSLVEKMVKDETGLSFSPEDCLLAQKGLSPISSGGLDNCLKAYSQNLLIMAESQKASA